MFVAPHKNRFVAPAAALIGALAVLGDVAVTRSPVPLAYLALALLVVGLHALSLGTTVRRMLFLTGIVASIGSLVLMVAKFA